MKKRKLPQHWYALSDDFTVRKLAFALFFGVVGVVLLWSARAATPVAFFEAEGASLSGSASVGNDAAASSGQYVQLGSTGSTSYEPLAPGTKWQWQLTGTVNETVLDGVSGPKMYDIDMFNASSALISRLKAKGIYVVCYVESGDWAQGRPDAGDYAPSILGNAIGGFPDEKYINVTMLDSPAGPTGKTLRQIMTARLTTARNKGCQGIEPDLDDLHTYGSGTLGFSISKAQMVAYNRAIIDIGHSLGMSVGLKNGASGTTGATSFEKLMLDAGADWVVNEECNQYDECNGYSQFIAAGKAVFQVEYLDNQDVPYAGANGTCALNNAANFDGIVKDSSSSLAALPWISCR